MQNIMEVITLGNHVVRKALILSLNEMAVLCDIVKMSNSPKYNFTCRKSKEKIADWLDLSRQTVHTIINTLKIKGYIISFDEGLRPSGLIYELNTASEEIGIYIKNGDIEMISKKISEIIDDLSVKNLDSSVKKLDSGVKILYSEVSKNFTQDTSKIKEKEKINNIPSEKKVEDISLLTSNETMYEVSKPTIIADCTITSEDITIPISEPKKKAKSNFQSNPERYIWINAKLKEWNDNSPADIQIKKPKGQERTGYFSLGLIYDKYGEEKASAFFQYILYRDSRYRNQFSLATPKNQEEFENFYQDPEEEQPKYLGSSKWDSYKRFKNELEEPSLGSFYNEDSFYAALENFYSKDYSGTALVKKVRERVKEINCKYKNY
jgi:DNA-binding Lrp family transcriptional regulator